MWRTVMQDDALLCLSGRPDGLVYQVVEAGDMAALVDSGAITIQHEDSNTHWFYPSRTSQDAYSVFRRDFRQLKEWITS